MPYQIVHVLSPYKFKVMIFLVKLSYKMQKFHNFDHPKFFHIP